jgi:branched-chain amino acid transport system ATP-binding protein
MATITRMATELGVGCVLVEQYVDVVLSFCESVLVLESGKVAYFGPTDDLRRHHHHILENAIGLKKVQLKENP